MKLNRRGMLAGLVAVAGGSAVALGSSKDTQTNGVLNGRWWKVRTPHEQVPYVMGFVDSINTASTVVVGVLSLKLGQQETPFADVINAVSNDYMPITVNYGELVNAVTKLYRDSLNVRLPIPTVMRVATMQFNGASADEVEKELARNRSLIAESS